MVRLERYASVGRPFDAEANCSLPHSMPIQSKNNQARKQVQFISASKPRLKLLTMAKNKTINVKGTVITVLQGETTDFILLLTLPAIKTLQIQMTSLKTGCETEILSSCWGFGNNCTTRILNTSNSMCLENKPA